MAGTMFKQKFHRGIGLISAAVIASMIISSCGNAAPKASEKLSSKLEPFTGTVEHIFFHPLIVFPQISFPKSSKGGYICDWFVTLDECNKIIAELYDRGFILVSVKDLYEIRNGQAVKKQLLCPAGKKPLIISVDDVNYYPTMQTHGMAKKLLVKDNKLVSLINVPEGGEKVLENSELMEVVDSFVAKHPDFSFNGAKGIIALTGYNGVFGYDTHKLKSPTYETEKVQAIKIAEFLKKDGWEFASHGYRHLQEGHISAAKLEADALRWRNEVEPITGPTQYHIYPFGDIIRPEAPELSILMKYGFRYFFGVSFNSGWTEHGSWIYENRIPIDGKYMMGIVSGSRNSRFCDIKKVIDPMRVKYFMN
jgi:hypothetical protein